MVKLINTFLLFWMMSVILSSAVEKQGFYEFADSVLKGGTKFTLEQTQDVSLLTDVPAHHLAIVEINMLGSIEDEARYLRAIDKATDYIEHGNVEWAREFLRMQRGFIYGLIGDRENGVKDLIAVLNADRLSTINSIEDPILDIMRKRTRDLSLDLDSLMRQSVGNYYMDFRKEGGLPVEAFRYFSSIKSEPFRNKCLLELKSRLGDAEFEKIVRSSENLDSRFDPKNILEDRESKTNKDGRRQEDRKSPRSPNHLREKKNQIDTTKPESINPFWYLGTGLIIGLIIAILLGRTKLFRGL